MLLFEFLVGCFIGFLWCCFKQNVIQPIEDDKAAENAKYVRTNEGYMEASRDGTKVINRQLSRREYRRRLDNYHYDTLKTDAWQDEADAWHMNGVKPVYFHKHVDRT